MFSSTEVCTDWEHCFAWSHCRIAMEDGSCEVLASLFGQNIAHLLGIRQEEWSEIENIIRQHGPISLQMV